MVVTDAVCRLLPDVLGNENSAKNETFGDEGLLEFPQYTRPADFRGQKVPAWLSLDLSNKTGEIVTLPIREHIEYPINEQLIIEYYSK